jgi:hypothetical protein
VATPDGAAGILGLAMTNLDNDNVPEVTFFTDIDEHLIIADSQTGQVDWQSDGLDAPFNGYTLYESSASSANDRRNVMALASSTSGNGNGGGVVFGVDFDTKEEIWRTVLPATISGVQDLLAGDLDGDGRVEVVTFGSDTREGQIHVLDGLTGAIRAVFRKVSTSNEAKKAYPKTLLMIDLVSKVRKSTKWYRFTSCAYFAKPYEAVFYFQGLHGTVYENFMVFPVHRQVIHCKNTLL